MTINDFVKHYSNESLFEKPLGIKTTALRGYIKENRVTLSDEKIVKFTDGLKSVKIDIIDPDKLIKKLT